MSCSKSTSVLNLILLFAVSLFFWGCMDVFKKTGLRAEEIPDVTSQLPVKIKNGGFYGGEDPIYLLGAITTYISPLREWDRRGPWSQHRVYKNPLDSSIMDELGLNSYQPYNFVSSFITKKHYPDLLNKRFIVDGIDWNKHAEEVAEDFLNSMNGKYIFQDFIMGGFEGFATRAKNIIPDEYYQKNRWWDAMLPYDPSYPKSYELYETMYYDATKFIIEKGGNPVVYELVNEAFYNSFSKNNMDGFSRYLKRKYKNDISRANRRWRTSFRSFKEPVNAISKTTDSEKGLWVDWMTFQSEVIAEHIRMFKKIVLSADKRERPKYFTFQPLYHVSSMGYANAFNMTFMDFLDVMCTEYTGLNYDMRAEEDMELDGIMETGLAAGNNKKILGAALAKAYSMGRPIIDNEMSTARYENGMRVTSQPDDIETALWNEVIHGFSGSMVYNLTTAANFGWKTYEEAKKVALSAYFLKYSLLNPYNYSEEAVFGLKRFSDNIKRLSEVVLPRPRVVGKVGVLFLDHQTWLQKGREVSAYIPWQQALRRLHMSHDFIIAENLNSSKDLERFSAIFCPNIIYPSDKLRMILKEYVSKGGILIVSPFSFTKDDYAGDADEKPLLGLKFNKLKTPFVDELNISYDSPNKKLNNKYRAVVDVLPEKAKTIYKWRENQKPAVLLNNIGKGKIYTLTFNEGSKESLTGIFGVILESNKIEKNNDLVNMDDGQLDTLSSIDMIDRGDKRLYHLVNWSMISKMSKMMIYKPLPEGLWNIYDAVNWKRIKSPSGKTKWSMKEIENGIPLYLPKQKRVLIFMSKNPVKWEKGEIGIAELIKEAQEARERDLKYMKQLQQESSLDKRKIIESRNIHGVDYSSLSDAIPILDKKLRKGSHHVAWGHERSKLRKGEDGKLILTAKPKPGLWGGIRITFKKNFIKVPKGKWELYLELNFNGIDSLENIEISPRLYIKCVLDPPLYQKAQQREVTALDIHPKTWESRTFDLGEGPFKFKELFIQYKENPKTSGVEIRRVLIRKVSDNTLL